MDFAKRQMLKYGWEEGKGLGKNQDGITTAIKSSLKFDNAGIGHEIGKDLVNNWWDNVYSAASNNIKVKNENGNIEMDLVNEESVEITTKNYSVKDFKKKNKTLEYGTFLKSSKLTAKGEEKYSNVVTPEETGLYNYNPISHDTLYSACEGRTAHKGARHGIKMSGKLSRLEKQEKMLMKKLQSVSISDEKDRVSKKLKKLTENKETEEPLSQGSTSEKKKKKKKKRKSVSFNETVTEYHTQELDTSSQSNESNCDQLIILESTINDNNPERQDDANFQDEGIEQDCDMRSEDLGQQSFEEVQKSKKERKKKKKAQMLLIQEEADCIEEDIKKEKKKQKATQKFLEAVLADEDSVDKYKRKHDEEDVTSKRKKKKKKDASINSIAKSLGKVCKISDTE